MLSTLCLANADTLRRSSEAGPSTLLQPTSPMPAGGGGIGRNPAKQLVWWLHIPKCGTSFASSAHLYAEDPSHKQACCGPNHKRLPASAPASTLQNVVAMFREPKQRAASAYYYLKYMSNMSAPKADRCCTEDWGWSRQTYEPIRREIRFGAPFDATLASFVGCQTNMVLGHGCMEMPVYHMKHNGSSHVADKAIEHMEMFRFVGLESQWLVSICLFNSKMTGTRFVTSEQVGFLQPGSGKHKDSGKTAYTEYDVTGYPDDPLDDRLYAAVKERFEKEIAAHAVSEDACPFVDSDEAERRWRLRFRTPWMGMEDSWLDEETVNRLGIELETPPLERELQLAAV